MDRQGNRYSTYLQFKFNTIQVRDYTHGHDLKDTVNHLSGVANLRHI